MRMRRIATIGSYDDLVAAFYARAEELNASRECLEEVAGLPRGVISKFLGPSRVRRIGMASMGPLLGVLGLKLVMVEDAEALARVAGRLKQRDQTRVRHKRPAAA